jgi:hypothetical protein
MERYEREVLDTRILQKVNAAHRGAFQEKFPNQLEHLLRLVTERLHLGLDKRNGVDPANIETWRLLPAEIRDLAEAMYFLNEIKNTLQSDRDTI